MNSSKNKKTKVMTMFRFVVFAFIGGIALNLMSQQMQINKKKLELKKIQSDLAIQNVNNKKLNERVIFAAEKDSEYIEKVAREDLNLAKPGERVFVNVAGN